MLEAWRPALHYLSGFEPREDATLLCILKFDKCVGIDLTVATSCVAYKVAEQLKFSRYAVWQCNVAIKISSAAQSCFLALKNAPPSFPQVARQRLLPVPALAWKAGQRTIVR